MERRPWRSSSPPSSGNVKTKSVSAAKLSVATLLLIYGGCKSDSAAPSVATTITANSATTFTAVAGTPVSPSPSVVIKDQNGTAMSGVVVTFAVTGGGGTASGASVTSDAQGIATLGSWTLGTAAGPNTLTASSGTLTPVSFSATDTAGVPASMVASAGNNQADNPGTPVAVAPAVIIKDANGNPKSDVVVSFVVGSGGGSVTGASATSNAAGIATVGSWTLGGGGQNTLIASATGLPSVTFTATAISANCSVRLTHVFGTTTNGTLASDDCQFSDGSFVDFYTTTLPQADMYFFRETASFNAYIVLGFPDGSNIAENNDSPTSSNSEIKALLPAGTYLVGANSFDPNVTGDYSITSSVAVTKNGACHKSLCTR